MSQLVKQWSALTAVSWEAGEANPHYQKIDQFYKGDLLAFYMDIGSMFTLVDDESDAAAIRETLHKVASTCEHGWHWTLDEFTTFTPDPEGKSTMPDGTKVKVSDLRRHLWFNFDSADDAMLCRLAIGELRSGKHVERGRLS